MKTSRAVIVGAGNPTLAAQLLRTHMELGAAWDDFRDEHPETVKANRFKSIAKWLGSAAAIASVPLFIDGTTRAAEAPTLTERIIGGVETAIGGILFSTAVWFNNESIDRLAQAEAEAKEDFVPVALNIAWANAGLPSSLPQMPGQSQ